MATEERPWLGVRLGGQVFRWYRDAERVELLDGDMKLLAMLETDFEGAIPFGWHSPERFKLFCTHFQHEVADARIIDMEERSEEQAPPPSEGFALEDPGWFAKTRLGRWLGLSEEPEVRVPSEAVTLGNMPPPSTAEHIVLPIESARKLLSVINAVHQGEGGYYTDEIDAEWRELTDLLGDS